MGAGRSHRGSRDGRLLLTLEACKWLLAWLYALIFNPREGIDAVRESWELLAIGSGLVFVLGFLGPVRPPLARPLAAISDRLAAANDSDAKIIAAGPAWLEREELPARMQVQPRIG